jgi:hypothetical protein
MALSELQVWLLRELTREGGKIEGAPTRSGTDAEAIELAIEGLIRRDCVTIVGPPNLNSYFGQDVDELHLRPAGLNYMRTLR